MAKKAKKTTNQTWNYEFGSPQYSFSYANNVPTPTIKQEPFSSTSTSARSTLPHREWLTKRKSYDITSLPPVAKRTKKGCRVDDPIELDSDDTGDLLGYSKKKSKNLFKHPYLIMFDYGFGFISKLSIQWKISLKSPFSGNR